MYDENQFDVNAKHSLDDFCVDKFVQEAVANDIAALNKDNAELNSAIFLQVGFGFENLSCIEMLKNGQVEHSKVNYPKTQIDAQKLAIKK